MKGDKAVMKKFLPFYCFMLSLLFCAPGWGNISPDVSSAKTIILNSNGTATYNGSSVTDYGFVWHADQSHANEYFTSNSSSTEEFTEAEILSSTGAGSAAVYIAHDIRYISSSATFTGTAKNGMDSEYVAYYDESVYADLDYDGPYIFACLPTQYGGGGGGRPGSVSSTVPAKTLNAMTHSASDAYKCPVLHIASSGTYRLSGTWNGQIWVDVGKKNTITLILDGITVTCGIGPALVIYKAKECEPYDDDAGLSTATKSRDVEALTLSGAGAVIYLSKGTTNNITGSNLYRMLTTDKKSSAATVDGTDYKQQKKLYKLDGAFHSRVSTVIGGEGVLNVTSSTYEGLDTEMHLTIVGGTVTAFAPDDGININEDYVSTFTLDCGSPSGGSLNVVSTGGDGIDSNGYIILKSGTLNIYTAVESGPEGAIDALDELGSAGVYKNSDTSSLLYNWSKFSGSSNNIPVITTNPVLPEAQAKAAYSTTLTASNTVKSWTKNSGTLPSGLSLSSSGAISGTPAESGTFTFSVKAAGSSYSNVKGFTLTVGGEQLAISADNFPDPAFLKYINDSNFDTDKDGYLSEEEIAKVTTINASSKEISSLKGIEYFTSLASLNFSGNNIKEIDLSGYSNLKTVSFSGQKSSGLVITDLGDGTYRADMSSFVSSPDRIQNVTATGCTVQYDSKTYTATFNAKPSTVTYTYNTGFGSAYMDVTATTAESQAPLIVTASILQSADEQLAYSVTLKATGAASTWSKTKGTIPSGLALNASTGVISGTPKKTGKFTFTIQAENSHGTDTKEFTLTVIAAETPVIATSSLPYGILNEAYTATQIKLSNSADVTWSVSGTLPTGITFNTNTATLSGTPTKAGKFSLTFKAESTQKKSATAKLALNVYEKPSITNDSKLADATVNKNYSIALRASGTKTIVWNVGKLPDGLIFTAKSGTIKGKIASAGSYSFDVTASNDVGIATKTMSFDVKDVAPKIKGSLAAGTTDVPYSSALTASGTGEMTWSLTGDLPDGLSFDPATATLSGIPTEIWAKKNVTVTVSNTGGPATKSMKLTINGVKPVISTASLPDGLMSTDYSASLDITGTRTIKTTVDGLPSGLSYSDGKITGKPTAYGKFKVAVTAENPAGTSTKSYNLIVKAPPVITTASLNAGTAGKSYKAALTAAGTMPITWSVAEGSSLPDGFSLSKGILKGSPKTYGNYKFTLTATNEIASVSHDYTLAIEAVAPEIKASSLPKGTAGKHYSTAIKVTGTTPLSWDIEGLPESLDFNEGTISGTYNYYFNGKVKITATNPKGSATKEFTLLIDAVKTAITTTSLASGTAGKPYSATLTATGTSPITWSWTGAPKGLSLDAETGAISGTPTEDGNFNVSVTAANTAANKSASKKLKLAINAASEQNAEDGTESYYDSDSGKDIETPETLSYETYGNIDVPANVMIRDNSIPVPSKISGYKTAAELPEIEADEDGLYDFNVSLDQKAETGAKLFWFVFHYGQEDSDDDNIVEFYDSDGEEIDSVPEDHNLKLSFWLNKGVIYKSLIAVDERYYR